ncbi:MAG: hypothetical protein C0472_02295, partial [Erythrobacter sp.]|nr:hypothetical protein [Erythrobacter sp.]
EGEEQPLLIERSDSGPREAARSNRQLRPSRSGNDNAYVKAKPPQRGFAKGGPGPRPAPAPGGGGPKPGKPAHKRKFKHS